MSKNVLRLLKKKTIILYMLYRYLNIINMYC